MPLSQPEARRWSFQRVIRYSPKSHCSPMPLRRNPESMFPQALRSSDAIWHKTALRYRLSGESPDVVTNHLLGAYLNLPVLAMR